MESRIQLLAISLIATFGAACAGARPTGTSPFPTAQRVDIQRMNGTWYVVAEFPNDLERYCFGTTVSYAARSDGDMDLLRRCNKGSLDGPIDEAYGRIRVYDAIHRSKLGLSYIRPIWAPYWIIEVGADYDYAVIGTPKRDRLWILSRTQSMDAREYADAISRLRSNGFDIAKLITVLQVEAAPLYEAPRYERPGNYQPPG